jgi:hypothetical protein
MRHLIGFVDEIKRRIQPMKRRFTQRYLYELLYAALSLRVKGGYRFNLIIQFFKLSKLEVKI